MRCLSCNEVYTENGTQFCSDRHRKRYLHDHALCKTPHKKSWWVEEDAQNFIDTHEDLYKVNLHPYICSCGLWHIGHSIKEEQQELAHSA